MNDKVKVMLIYIKMVHLNEMINVLFRTILY